MADVHRFSDVQSTLQAVSGDEANEFAEKMEEQRREAFENALKHNKASMMINKYVGFSAISKMIVNS